MFIPSPPPELDINPVIEHRTRFERRLDQDLSRAADDNKSILNDRERVGFDFKYGKKWSGEVRYQYSHILNWTDKSNFSDEGRDLLLGHLDYKTDDGATISVGRQMIRKGDRRLFDISDFAQRNKVFDVVRYKKDAVDVFAGKLGITSNIKDISKIVGGTYDSKFGQTLAVWKRDDKNADISSYTLDHYYAKKGKEVDYQLEGAIQFGKSGGKDVSAFWVNGRATHPFDKKASVWAEANVASGGGNGSTTRTFDPLYGTAHAPYGLMDIQGIKNVVQLELGATYKVNPKLSGQISFNNYQLYDKSDGWYGSTNINKRPGGSFVDATGSRGKDVGQEYNVALTYTPTKHDTATLELGVFKPGAFVRSFTLANTKDQFWLGLTYGFKF